jgi:O-antigen/teichoic acid export membrane protein
MVQTGSQWQALKEIRMNPVLIQALVLHILTAIAGGFAVKYGVDGGAMEAIIGGAAAAAGVGWSIYDKKKGA